MNTMTSDTVTKITMGLSLSTESWEMRRMSHQRENERSRGKDFSRIKRSTQTIYQNSSYPHPNERFTAFMALTPALTKLAAPSTTG